MTGLRMPMRSVIRNLNQAIVGLNILTVAGHVDQLVVLAVGNKLVAQSLLTSDAISHRTLLIKQTYHLHLPFNEESSK